LFRTTRPGPSLRSGRQSTRARYRDYVILRSGFCDEESGPGPEGLKKPKTRSFTLFRTTRPGPSLRSGRQSTRGRRRDYVILRSGFCDEESGPGPEGLKKPQNQVLHFVQDDRRGVILRACSTARRIWLVLKILEPGPSLRSGRQGQVLRCAQDDRRIWLVLRVLNPDPLQSFRTTLCRLCSSIPETSPMI